MVDWSPVDDALSRSADSGRVVDLWWRDDDLATDTPALGRLFSLAGRFDLPLALAVIPARIEPSLVARIEDEPSAAVLVHGLRHVSHARPSAKKAEFGPDRPLEQLAADAAEGLRSAWMAFGANLRPVLVPPWNRIAPDLVPLLPGLGYRGLSTFKHRTARQPVPGLVEANTHLDPIDWHGTRGLRDPQRLVAELGELIARRAEGATDEPIGLLTHHLVHDQAVWDFCAALLERLSSSAAVRYPFVDEIFSVQGMRGAAEPR